MKSTAEILAMIENRISNVYVRPLMYGGTGTGLEVLLWTCHNFWSEIQGRYDDFDTVWRAVLKEQDCGSADFAGRYEMDHPQAKDEEIASYTVEQWRKVSDRLGLPVSAGPPPPPR